MNPDIRAAYITELRLADAAKHQADLATAFAHLERAHILGQRYLVAHLDTHFRMLDVARQRRDGRETRGQLVRILAVVPGYLSGWVPKGNTGGANVSAVRPMPIPSDLAPLLAGYSVTRDVAGRLAMWTVIAAAMWYAARFWVIQ